MKKNYWILLYLLSMTVSISAQTTLTGKVTDEETGEELIYASIVVTKNGNFIQGSTTDFDGNFSIKVDPGIYDIEVSYTGYQTQKITGIDATEGNATKVDVQLNGGHPFICGFGCGGYKIPLIRQEDTTQGIIITSERIKNLPTRNINELTSMAAGVTFINN